MEPSLARRDIMSGFRIGTPLRAWVVRNGWVACGEGNPGMKGKDWLMGSDMERLLTDVGGWEVVMLGMASVFVGGLDKG
jgi:hypothetical protein